MMFSKGIASLLSLSLVAAYAAPKQQSWSASTVRVPVILGVMSRVAEKINLSLAYVAKLNASDPEFGATCMHGRKECAGNVQQLCVAKHTPMRTWWEFVMCQNYHGRDEIGRPDVALKCARIAEIDWEDSGVGECAGLDGSGTGEEGVRLLHHSIRVTESLGITTSCTVVINSEKVCVHDGTWKRCENGHEVRDFVDQIEDEYQKLNGSE